jgi:hypothetical protein
MDLLMTILSRSRKSVDVTVEDLAARFIVEAKAHGESPDKGAFAEFKNTQRSSLSRYHLSLGMAIRNHFGLWDPSHPLTQHWHQNPDCRDIVDGVDYSEDHPDAVSSAIMRAMWDQLQ